MFIVNQTIPRALRNLGYSRRAGRRDRRLHRRAQDDHRRARLQPRAPAGVRVLDGRQHDPLHGSRHDDGCGAAVHLGCDLQDGEHARGRVGRRRRAAAHRGVEARPEGGRDLPRQLQGRAAALHAEEGWRDRSPEARRRARPAQVVERIVEHVIVQEPVRQKLPRTRNSKTFSFRVADCHGYATVGEYEDGRPGELFLKVAKQGSTLAGIMDAFAISVSHGLQYGVPLEAFVRDVHQHALRARGHDRRPRHPDRHQPRRLHLPPARRRVPAVRQAREMGVLTVGERMQPTLPGVEEATIADETRRRRPPARRPGAVGRDHHAGVGSAAHRRART